MTEKRFKLGYVCGDYGLIADDEWIDLHSMSENSEKNVQICINKMNELADENEELKSFKSRVFNLLQDEIREESELLDYYLKEKAPCNADRQQIIIGVLKRLQKELEE